MATKVAINGFGRIGRLVARAILSRTDHDLELVSINDLGDANANALLFKRDSVHGNWAGDVSVDGDFLVVDGKKIKVTAERDPANLPHAELGVAIALECTGIFTSKDKASAHLTAGAKRVVISAPGTNVDKTIVFGVNHDQLSADDIVISNASCTTNCLAPLAKVLNDAIGIDKGFMTTIHSYTNDQRMLDQMHGDMRRARGGAQNMIPTTTGAAIAVGEVLPDLKGKLDGISVRVPTPNVSIVDLVATLNRTTTSEEITDAFRKAASENLKGILDVSDNELVSVDFKGNPHSSIVDAAYTKVMDGNFVKLLSWYDNEWGYSNRCVDLVEFIATKGL